MIFWAKNHTPSDDNILGAYDYTKRSLHPVFIQLWRIARQKRRQSDLLFSGEMKNKPTRLPTVERVQELDNYSLVLSF
ncbi:MAG: hypothetical protein R3C26_12105 [Calditrichia bacterium]